MFSDFQKWWETFLLPVTQPLDTLNQIESSCELVEGYQLCTGADWDLSLYHGSGRIPSSPRRGCGSGYCISPIIPLGRNDPEIAAPCTGVRKWNAVKGFTGAGSTSRESSLRLSVFAQWFE